MKCIILTLLTAGEAYSQANLKEGYILKSETDTVFGFIEFDYVYLDGVIAAKYAYETDHAEMYLKGGFLYGLGLKNDNITVESSKTEFTRDNVFKTEYANELGGILGVGCNFSMAENRALGF